MDVSTSSKYAGMGEQLSKEYLGGASGKGVRVPSLPGQASRFAIRDMGFVARGWKYMDILPKVPAQVLNARPWNKSVEQYMRGRWKVTWWWVIPFIAAQQLLPHVAQRFFTWGGPGIN
eukprot:NODE_8749_length_502_cov_46.543046_g7682_i0.p2 GENE.NODE_8749_length_502_cov_46.543046_g7682_i0~~NODE_8749_length_502_cov_46.543046_g7682_i0.p2  ORF type:complete len:118 (-),score=24.57 NODE_8749_length_502_cov_46.543046_g7682_i0:66-419(-)